MELVYEGLKLTVIGMTIVSVFLVLLMTLIMISARIFKQGAGFQNVPIEEGRQKHLPVPVISAAIAAYRARKKQ